VARVLFALPWLAAFIIQLDAAVVIVALIPVCTSSVTYFLAKRHANTQAEVARGAAAEAVAEAADAKAKLGEVKELVDGRYDALLAEIDKRDARIDRLEKLLEGGPA
jgi:hypothetical protein